MTRITIGLATYNKPGLLKRAVKSILNQSHQNFILYIGNDYVKKEITFKSLEIKKNLKILYMNLGSILKVIIKSLIRRKF